MLEVLVIIFSLINTLKIYLNTLGGAMFKRLLAFFKLQQQCNKLKEEEPVAAIRSNKVIFLCCNSDDLFAYTQIAKSMSLEEPEYYLVKRKWWGWKLETSTYIDAHYAMNNETEETAEETAEEEIEEDENTKLLKQKIAEKKAKENSAKEN